MKLLFLAPQPFFQERGTPIAVRLALQVLARRGEDRIDLLTYHEGSDITIPNVTINRIAPPKFLSNIGPGASFKKLLCDFYFFVDALKLVWRSRRDPYDLIHAVEESVFIALLISWIWKIPYVYDMDSSLALQVTEKWRILKPLQPILRWFEGLAIKNSLAVVPVCDALAVIAKEQGAKDQEILRDISLLDVEDVAEPVADVRASIHGDNQKTILMYIGNLERYQGVHLFIESFAAISARTPDAHAVIIGGTPAHLSHYKQRIEDLRVSDRVHLLGPKPVSLLSGYLAQADILVSPRTLGNNTPMKIYSYLHSGRPILATRLPTHTQVMDDRIALLAEPVVADFSRAMLELITDRSLRERIGSAARSEAETKYTFSVFTESLNRLYDRVGLRLESPVRNLSRPIK